MRRGAPGREPFRTGLAAAALEEDVRGVILFNASFHTLRATAGEWAEMLGAAAGCPVETVWLGSTEGDDALWGRPGLRRADDGTASLGWRSGCLYPPSVGLRLVVIPDLARLSLAAARACVALAGAHTAWLARHGRDARWAPRLAWLAGLRRAEVGEVSPHLLDRFPLRLSAPPSPPAHTGTAIHAWVLRPPQSAGPPTIQSEELKTLARAARRHPAFAAETVAAVASYFPAPGEGVRRELSLARLARGLARLDGAAVVSPGHLRTAARIVGLERAAVAPAAPELRAQAPASPASRAPAALPREVHVPASVEMAMVASGDAAGEVVWKGDAESELAIFAVPGIPYPEDEAPVLRDLGSLRVPMRAGPRDAVSGPVIGTERAGSLRDLAVVETILEALKYRPLRRAKGCSRPLIHRGDLRSYRRAAAPEHLLVVAIDFTALRGCNWEDALLPHLSWAYVERARICVVRIGAAGARSPLRAEAVDGRNLLAAPVEPALTAAPGAATPLAHGLDLAMGALRPALQHGRTRVRAARLVVVSDGRGNVPLAVSRAGEPPTEPVYDRGVRDALEVAREVQSLRGVEVVLLDPRPAAYPGLPGLLAQALGCRVEPIGGGEG